MSKEVLAEKEIEFVLSNDDVIIRYDRDMDYLQIISSLDDEELTYLLSSALRIVLQGEEPEYFTQA